MNKKFLIILHVIFTIFLLLVLCGGVFALYSQYKKINELSSACDIYEECKDDEITFPQDESTTPESYTPDEQPDDLPNYVPPGSIATQELKGCVTYEYDESTLVKHADTITAKFDNRITVSNVNADATDNFCHLEFLYKGSKLYLTNSQYAAMLRDGAIFGLEPDMVKLDPDYMKLVDFSGSNFAPEGLWRNGLKLEYGEPVLDDEATCNAFMGDDTCFERGFFTGGFAEGKVSGASGEFGPGLTVEEKIEVVELFDYVIQNTTAVREY